MAKIQLRRDTVANWTSVNPVLASGEQGLETDTRLRKTGDGITAWNDLEYDLPPLASEAEALAGTNDTKAITPAKVAVVAEKYDVRRSGAVLDGSTDDATALADAVTAVTSVAGTILLPEGKMALASNVTIPENVNLVGVAGGLGSTIAGRWGSMIVATAAGAGLTFEGGGGTSGRFTIHGNGVGTGPLWTVGAGSNRRFESIFVRGATGTAWRIQEAQNGHFVNCVAYDADILLEMDEGCGGHKFEACEFTNAGTWHLVVDETTGAGPYGSAGPSHNTWDHCLFERGPVATGTFDGCVDIRQGNRNVFRDCVMSSDGYGTTVALLRVAAGAEAVLDGAWLFGEGTDLGIHQVAGTVVVQGRTLFQSMADAWRYDSGTAIVWDEPSYSTVTNRWHASSASLATVTSNHGRPIRVKAESTDAYLARFNRQGDASTRLDISTVGTLSWADGTAAADTTLARVGANVLAMGSGDTFRVDGTWNGGMLRLGSNWLWVDSTGDLRIKNGAPTSDTDGTVVGTQT